MGLSGTFKNVCFLYTLLMNDLEIQKNGKNEIKMGID